MNAKLIPSVIFLGFVSSAAFAQANQAPQTDYQRAMNSVNNASSAAYGQPQPDDDAVGNTGTGTAANNPSTPPLANNAQYQNGPTNLPTDGIANAYSANGAPGGFGAATPNRIGFGNVNNGMGAASTTSGSIGLGAFNASPYNSSPNTNGRGGGQSFTGQ